MENVNTWADSFGRWHASVPLSNSRTESAQARRLIKAELSARMGSYDPSTLHVKRERVTNHGTVVYGEV